MHTRNVACYGALPDASDFAALKARYLRLKTDLRAAQGAKNRLEAASALLNAVGQLARNAPTSELSQRWLAQYRALSGELGMLRAQFSGDDMPSSFMLVLDSFSTRMLRLGDTALQAVEDSFSGIGKGIEATARSTPLLLLGALGVLGLVAYGYVRHGGVRVRRT